MLARKTIILHIHTLTRGTVGCGSLFLFALFDTVFNRFFPMQGWTEAGQLPVEAPRSESTDEILLVSISARLRPFGRHIADTRASLPPSLPPSLSRALSLSLCEQVTGIICLINSLLCKLSTTHCMCFWFNHSHKHVPARKRMSITRRCSASADEKSHRHGAGDLLCIQEDGGHG